MNCQILSNESHIEKPLTEVLETVNQCVDHPNPFYGLGALTA